MQGSIGVQFEFAVVVGVVPIGSKKILVNVRERAANGSQGIVDLQVVA